MKIRNGFVSNSSSSSYIIALKDTTNPCPHCHRKDETFLDLIEKSANRNVINYYGYEEIMKNINYELVNSDPTVIATLNKYKDWIIADITLDDGDSSIHVQMNKLIKSGDLVILHNEQY